MAYTSILKIKNYRSFKIFIKIDFQLIGKPARRKARYMRDTLYTWGSLSSKGGRTRPTTKLTANSRTLKYRRYLEGTFREYHPERAINELREPFIERGTRLRYL